MSAKENENLEGIHFSQHTNDINVNDNKNNLHNQTDSSDTSDTKTSKEVETVAQTDKLSNEIVTKNTNDDSVGGTSQTSHDSDVEVVEMSYFFIELEIITTVGGNEQRNSNVQPEASESTPLPRECENENNAKEHEKVSGFAFDNDDTEIEQSDDIVIQKMAEEHQLTRIGKRLYCQRCNKHISISVRNIKHHLNEELHENNADLFSGHSNQNKEIKNESNLKKMPLFKFVKFIAAAEYTYAIDVIINKKYCISHLAFAFLTEVTPRQLWCFVCEEDVSLQDLKDHLQLKSHDAVVKLAPILIRADSEFIREVRPGKYHCGYCNILEPWKRMVKHFESANHKRNKEFANWRLSLNMSDIGNQNKKHKRVCYGDFAVDTFLK